MTSGPMPSPAITASFMIRQSTTSSVMALTSRPMADRTSAGTWRSSRSMIVAPSPSASWLSCAARMLTPALAKQGADLAQRAGLVVVVDDQVDALGAQIEVAAVDLDDLLDQLRSRQRARDVHRGSVRCDRAHVDHAAVVGALRRGVDRRLHAALGCQRRCVDEGDLVLDHRREQAAQRRQLEHVDLFGGQLPTHLQRQRHR